MDGLLACSLAYNRFTEFSEQISYSSIVMHLNRTELNSKTKIYVINLAVHMCPISMCVCVSLGIRYYSFQCYKLRLCHNQGLTFFLSSFVLLRFVFFLFQKCSI